MTECGMDGERLSALVDGELPPDDRRAVEGHLAGCARCQAEVAALQTVRDRVAALPADQVAPEEWDRVWAGIAPRLPAGGRRCEPVLLRLWGRPRPMLAAAALLIAVITAGLVAYQWWPRSVVAPSGLAMAGAGEARLEWVSSDSDAYTLVVMAPAEGEAPVLWVSPTDER